MEQYAKHYYNAGLCVLPAIKDEKRPAIGSWKEYQKHLPTEAELNAWFANDHDALCIITGAVSGNLELIDFDHCAALYKPWADFVEDNIPGLLDKLVIETTQSGGRHVIYRCETEISGNMKLAQRRIPVEPHEIYLKKKREYVRIGGKEFTVRQDAQGKHVIVTLIETRGSGGLFLCDPTEGYELVQGSFEQLPTITETQRDTLLMAAWELNEYIPEPAPVPTGSDPSSLRPGDDYNTRGNVADLLTSHGWQYVNTCDDNQRWRRPGKEVGWSATLRTTDKVFYVFSTNAPPLEAKKPYSPFMTYTLLEHNGDFSKAASALSKQGYGQPISQPECADADISGICKQLKDDSSISVVYDTDEKTESLISDPGPMPMELLRIPGFISEVMDFCLENAPTRNHSMAFCGAVALQSVLGARKVRDPGDNRTNLYLIALAPTGSGKDAPREINSKLLEQIGMQKTLASRFASGESIEDKLADTPVVLCQTDEFDGILLQMKNASDGRTEAMLDRFKEVFTSSNKTMYTRCLAGKESKPIHQPSLTIFGSAVPVHYYSALSEKMLTDGFFSRTIAVEAPVKIEDQEPTIFDELPERISETAVWWSQCNPTPGNLANFNPRPAIVPMADDAREIVAEVRKYARQIQNDANDKNDVVTAAVWSRVRQMTRKLALIYAISTNYRHPIIDTAAITWARDFVFHQAQRMLFMANDHVSENPFHAQCLKVIKFLRNAPGQILTRGVLLGKMKCKAKELDEILLVLFEQGRIQPVEIKTKTKPATGWQFVF